MNAIHWTTDFTLTIYYYTEKGYSSPAGLVPSRYFFKKDWANPKMIFERETNDMDSPREEDFTKAMMAGKLRWCKFFY